MKRLEDNLTVVEALDAYMNENRESRGVLMATLLKTQELLGYVPEAIVRHIDEVLGVPASRIDSLLHYYDWFRTEPADYAEQPAPYVSGITKKISRTEIKAKPEGIPGNLEQALSLEDYLSKGGFKALVQALGTISTGIAQQIKDSGYKGRGDGGFALGLKWDQVANVDDPNKGIICNADTMNRSLDQKILKENPFKLIEAMIIAGYGVGAAKGYIYTPDTQEISHAIADAYAAGILGERVLGSDIPFDLEVRYSQDGFISPREVEVNTYVERDLNIHREKKAGDRDFGVYGRPLEYYITDKCIGCTKCAKNCPVSCISGANKVRHTINPKECISCGRCMSVCPVAAIVYTNLVHNVETLINLPDILLKGSETFKAEGAPKNPGRKIISLEGDINAPGLVEVPTDATLRSIIEEYGKGCKGQLKAVRVGGPMGALLLEDKLDAPVDFETPLKFGLIANVMEGFSLYVVGEETSMMDLAKTAAAYSVKESCGKCTPCREGTKRMEEILEQMEKGDRGESQFEKLEKLALIMEDASLCSLGQLAPTTLNSILKNFREQLFLLNHPII